MALRLIRTSTAAADARAGEPVHSAESEAPLQASGHSNRAWIMLVLVLVVAGVTLLVMERSAGPPVSTLPTPVLEGEPDIYMESPVVSQYHSDGTLEYQLVAEVASHFQQQALTELGQPHLTLYRGRGAPWSARARRGTLRRPPEGADEETVILEEDVTLEQMRGDGERILLTTPVLRLYPRRQFAETDQDVMIESSFGRTTATGLAGDLQRSVLELRSRGAGPVRTVLQPEQFK